MRHNGKQKTKFHKFFEALQKVMTRPEAIVLTDQEFWVAANALLAPEDRIAKITWWKWVSETMTSKSPENIEQVPDEDAEEFRLLIRNFRVERKMNLAAELLDETNKNRNLTWLLERKFNDLQMKNPYIGVGAGSGNNTTININVSKDSDKKMIDDIMAGKVPQLQQQSIEEAEFEEIENESEDL